MNFEFINPLVEPRWNEWVRDHEAATFFHTSEWARVLTESFGCRVQYGVLKDAQRVVALLPVMEVRSLLTGCRGVSLPFSDECAPLLGKGVTLESIVEPVQALGRRRGWDYLELRGDAESLPGAVRSDEFTMHYLVLESREELQFEKLKDSHRRNVQKARKEAVEIHRLQTRAAVDAYYALHCLTRRRHGLPPQPRRFFHAIHEHVIGPGHGFVLLARFGGHWIAGAVYFLFGTKALYKFGASNPAFQHLRANNLLMWEAIRECREAGAKQFSFGRSDPNQPGLLQFKRGWGAEESTLRYYRVGLRKTVYVKTRDRDQGSGMVSRIMRRTPMRLLRLVGAAAYRHMG